MATMLDNNNRMAAIQRSTATSGTSAISFGDPFQASDKSKYFNNVQPLSFASYTGVDNSGLYKQLQGNAVNMGTPYKPMDNSQYYQSANVNVPQSYTPQDLSQYYQGDYSNIKPVDTNVQAATSENQYYQKPSELANQGGNYLSSMFKNPNQVSLPTDASGKSYYDIADEQLQEQAKRDMESRMKTLSRDMAARGIEGGAAGQLTNQQNIENERALREGQQNISMKKLGDVFGAQQAREQQLMGIGQAQTSQASAQGLQERLANLNAEMTAQGMSEEAKRANLNAELQKAGLSQKDRETAINTALSQEQTSQADKWANVDAQIKKAGLDQNQQQMILDDLHKIEAEKQADKFNAIEAQLKEKGLNQDAAKAIMDDIAKNEGMKLEDKWKGVDAILQQQGLSLEQSKMIVNDLQKTDELKNQDKWNAINAQLEQNKITSGENIAYQEMAIKQQLAQMEINAQKALQNDKILADVANIKLQDALAQNNELLKTKSTAAYQKGLTSKGMTPEQIAAATKDMSEMEKASFQAGVSGQSSSTQAQITDTWITFFKTQMASLDPDSPTFQTDLKSINDDLLKSLQTGVFTSKWNKGVTNSQDALKPNAGGGANSGNITNKSSVISGGSEGKVY
jgi:hypothetical protein